MADDHSIMREGEGESKGPEQEQDPIRECLNEIAQKRRECRNATPSHKAALWAEIVGLWAEIVGLWGEIVYEADTPENQRKLAQAEKAAAQAKEAAAQAEKAAAQAVLDDPDATEEAKAAALEAKAAALEDKAAALEDKRAAQGQLVLLLELQREQAGVQHELARTEAARAGEMHELAARATKLARTDGADVSGSASALSRGEVMGRPRYADNSALTVSHTTEVDAGELLGPFQAQDITTDSALSAVIDEELSEKQVTALFNTRVLEPVNTARTGVDGLRLFNVERYSSIFRQKPDVVLVPEGSLPTLFHVHALVELKASNVNVLASDVTGQVDSYAHNVFVGDPRRSSFLALVTNLRQLTVRRYKRVQANDGATLHVERASWQGEEHVAPVLRRVLAADASSFECPEPSIGRRRVREFLGRGRTSVVYSVDGDVADEQIFAKELLPEFHARAEDELRLADRLQNSDLFAVPYAQETVDNRPVLWGRPVCTAFSLKDMQWKDWKRLLAAAQHAAGQGLVHRDFRPSNFTFRDGTGNLRVVDVGFAADAGASVPYAGSMVTASDRVLGALQDGAPDIALDWRDDFESILKCFVRTKLSSQTWTDRFKPYAREASQANAVALLRAWEQCRPRGSDAAFAACRTSSVDMNGAMKEIMRYVGSM